MNIWIFFKKFKSPYDVIKSSWILMRYIGIFQIMEPRNQLKADFETSITFLNRLKFFGAVFTVVLRRMSSIILYIYVFIYTGVSLSQGQPRIIIWTNFVGLDSLMLYTKFKDHQPAGFRKDFCRVFTIYGHDSYLGHMSQIIWTNLHSPIPLRLHKKFVFWLAQRFLTRWCHLDAYYRRPDGGQT